MQLSGPGDAMFTIIPIIVVIGFILVFGLIIFAIIKGIAQWSTNNTKPILTVSARIVNKRMNVRTTSNSGVHHDDHMIHQPSSHTNTTYYVTFELESGDRQEFSVSGKESGLLVEGDIGRLTFQGTRYKGFQR